MEFQVSDACNAAEFCTPRVLKRDVADPSNLLVFCSRSNLSGLGHVY